MFKFAGMAELADAQDLKSCGTNLPYRFDSDRRHQYADLAHLVERHLAKVEVASSSLVIRSIIGAIAKW